jgi:hypothetical protein
VQNAVIVQTRVAGACLYRAAIGLLTLRHLGLPASPCFGSMILPCWSRPNAQKNAIGRFVFYEAETETASQWGGRSRWGQLTFRCDPPIYNSTPCALTLRA